MVYEEITSPDGSRAIITCPKCRQQKALDISLLLVKGRKQQLKCRCYCRHIFLILLERRRSKRREVLYKGHVMQARPQNRFGKKWVEYKADIENISKHGLGLKFKRNTSLVPGQPINVTFYMSDFQGRMISKTLKIAHSISSTKIGCEFIDVDHFRNLWGYLLF